jgi:fructose-bisphosphate aldolase class II
MEIVQAIVQAAELENSPVIMQASQGAINYAVWSLLPEW